MKKIVLFLCFLAVSFTFAQERNCASMESLERRMQADPSIANRMAEIESYTQNKIQQDLTNRVDGSIITIPVVVHVIYSNANENISVAQIQSQIDVLNEDFRRTNSDADNTWSQAADTEIEFCMATIDPNGNATTGITRKSTTRVDWGTSDDMKKASQGGVDPWDTSQYLNMWIVPKMTSGGRTILGYAQFPGGNAATDGVVMAHNYFGNTGTVTAPFNLGRTTTHEVGHYLNLRHIWGDGGCSVDDFVSDTPASDNPNYGCATGHSSCGTTDMVQNYMDYSDDSCMNLFTQGQKARMRAVLEAGGVRRSLALSDKCGGGTTPTCNDGIQNGDETGVDCGGSCAPCDTQTACTNGISSFPYSEGFESSFGQWSQDSGDDFNWTRRSGGTPSTGTGPSSASAGSYYAYMESSSPNYSSKRAILNSPCFDLSNESQATLTFKYHMYGSNNMGSLALEASTDNGSSWTSIWSKSGNQGNSWQTATVNMNSYAGNSVKLRFNGVTGTTWQGDMAIDALSLSTSGGNNSCINTTLSLTLDNYPEETSWQITDNSGTVVASGGTYGSQPDGTTLTINNCLPAGCYTFTINDTYGDGICCSYGNGSYTLTNADSGATLASGGSFGSTEATNFCLSSTREDVVKEDITYNTFSLTLYPNPVRGNELNIVTKNAENATFRIVNTLGQELLTGELNDVESTINVSRLESGVYFIAVKNNDAVVTKQFIKK